MRGEDGCAYSRILQSMAIKVHITVCRHVYKPNNNKHNNNCIQITKTNFAMAIRCQQLCKSGKHANTSTLPNIHTHPQTHPHRTQKSVRKHSLRCSEKSTHISCISHTHWCATMLLAIGCRQSCIANRVTKDNTRTNTHIHAYTHTSPNVTKWVCGAHRRRVCLRARAAHWQKLISCNR